MSNDQKREPDKKREREPERRQQPAWILFHQRDADLDEQCADGLARCQPAELFGGRYYAYAIVVPEPKPKPKPKEK